MCPVGYLMNQGQGHVHWQRLLNISDSHIHKKRTDGQVIHFEVFGGSLIIWRDPGPRSTMHCNM